MNRRNRRNTRNHPREHRRLSQSERVTLNRAEIKKSPKWQIFEWRDPPAIFIDNCDRRRSRGPRSHRGDIDDAAMSFLTPVGRAFPPRCYGICPDTKIC